MLSNKDLKLINNVLIQSSIENTLIVTALDEIKELIIKIDSFNDNVAKSNYLQILSTLARELMDLTNEADLLEELIPKWQILRNNEISNKPIDEFYSELELCILAELIHSWAVLQKISSLHLKKMREIVRRYSSMPGFWQILCKLNGDEIVSKYTF